MAIFKRFEFLHKCDLDNVSARSVAVFSCHLISWLKRGGCFALRAVAFVDLHTVTMETCHPQLQDYVTPAALVHPGAEQTVEVMDDFWAGTLWVLKIWLYLIISLIMIPAMFGFSLGVSETYMTILVKTLEVLLFS